MKNIHVIPTDKPSSGYILGKCIKKLSDVKIGQLVRTHYMMFSNEYFQPQNIYITSDEEIKYDNYYLGEDGLIYCLVTTVNSNGKKIIITSDEDLIKDGVQAIDDEFLEWFVAHPSCEGVEVEEKQHFEFDKSKRINPLNGVYYSYKIIIPQEDPKQEGYICPQTKLQCRDECCVSAEDCHIEAGFGIVSDCEPPKEETIEEASHTAWINYEHVEGNLYSTSFKNGFKDGARWQAERMYSEGEVRDIIFKFSSDFDTKRNIEITLEEQKQWLKNFNNK
jgi:hypothetical protein